MKYLKKYENLSEFVENEKLAEKFEELKGLFIVFEYYNRIYFGQIKRVNYNYQYSIDGHFWYDGYNKSNFEDLEINKIKILNSFDKFEDAKQEYFLQLKHILMIMKLKN